MIICRFCKDMVARNEGHVKYAVRHYAHHACYLKAKGAAGFLRLHLWQLKNFPFILTRDMGFLPQLESEIAKRDTEIRR